MFDGDKARRDLARLGKGLLIVVGAWLVLMLVLAVINRDDNNRRPSNSDHFEAVDKSAEFEATRAGGSTSSGGASATAGQVLVTARGTADSVTDDFTVSAGCGSQKVTYQAAAADPSRKPTWINLQADDDNGMTQESLGPVDAGSGSGLWSLAPGRYAVEVTAWNAKWTVTVACR